MISPQDIVTRATNTLQGCSVKFVGERPTHVMYAEVTTTCSTNISSLLEKLESMGVTDAEIHTGAAFLVSFPRDTTTAKPIIRKRHKPSLFSEDEKGVQSEDESAALQKSIKPKRGCAPTLKYMFLLSVVAVFIALMLSFVFYPEQ